MQIIGVGKLGEAIVSGLLKADPFAELTLVAKSSQQAERLVEGFPGESYLNASVSTEPTADPQVIIAVKPHHVFDVAEQLTHSCEVVSVAAGISIEAMESKLPSGSKAVRAMTNLAVGVNQGMTGIAAAQNSHIPVWVSESFSKLGAVVEVDENQLGIVTGIAGSGPGFLYRIVEAFAKAGESLGLSSEQSQLLAEQTFIGAGLGLQASDVSAAELRGRVTTPNGTTHAGLQELENAQIDDLIGKVVQAARERGLEIGKGDS